LGAARDLLDTLRMATTAPSASTFPSGRTVVATILGILRLLALTDAVPA
jgi:hypothetical protein